MKRNWLVVGNASRARVLEESDKAGLYTHVADLVHPQSRQKSGELHEQHSLSLHGRVASFGHGPGGTAYLPRTDPHDREVDRFAREVAVTLGKGVASGRCAGIVLVAPDPFLGHLKSHLNVQTRKLLLRCLSADYTGLRDDELARRLGTKSPP